MKRILLIAACFAVGLIASHAFGDDGKLSDNPKIAEMHKHAMTLRKKHGLPAQQLDEECCRIAQRWANRMAKDSYMRHGGGEQIIARGYPTVRSCFAGWMNSSGHRQWVLCRRTCCGWGCQKSKTGQWFYAGVFRTKTKTVKVEVLPMPTKQEPAKASTEDGKTCTNGTCTTRTRRIVRIRR